MTYLSGTEFGPGMTNQVGAADGPRPGLAGTAGDRLSTEPIDPEKPSRSVVVEPRRDRQDLTGVVVDHRVQLGFQPCEAQ